MFLASLLQSIRQRPRQLKPSRSNSTACASRGLRLRNQRESDSEAEAASIQVHIENQSIEIRAEFVPAHHLRQFRTGFVRILRLVWSRALHRQSIFPWAIRMGAPRGPHRLEPWQARQAVRLLVGQDGRDNWGRINGVGKYYSRGTSWHPGLPGSPGGKRRPGLAHLHGEKRLRWQLPLTREINACGGQTVSFVKYISPINNGMLRRFPAIPN